MDVRTGSKSWGYSKRPRNWEKIMYRDLPEIGRGLESEASIDNEPEIDEIIPDVDEVEEIEEASIEKPKIEKPKITARVSKPVREELPRPLVDLVLPVTLVNPALLDSSFSHI